MRKVIISILLLLLLPLEVHATKQEDLGRRISNVALSAATTYANDFTYTYFWDGTPSAPISKKSVVTGYLNNAYKGIKSSGYTYGFKNRPGINGSFTNKYATYCETWAALIPYHAKGGGSTSSLYEKIPLNTANLKPGDRVQYTYPDAHIAIYVDNNNDSDPDTYRIAEAAGYNGGIRVDVAYFSGQGHRGKVTAMQRIPESAANLISYNVINASPDWHDSLDHFQPIVNSVIQKDKSGIIIIKATDYKQYNGTVQSREVEPASNGIVGYTVTTSNVEPTSGWTKISTRDSLDIETKVSGNGTFYVWVLDVGGNTASKAITVSGVDATPPAIGSASLKASSNTVTINISGASDSSGIREYSYYLENTLVATNTSASYTFTNLMANNVYKIKYAVTDNKGNTSISTVYEIKTEQVVGDLSLDITALTLKTGRTYALKATIYPFVLENSLVWSSSNSNVASVSNKGVVTANSVGQATIKVKVNNSEATCVVTVKEVVLSIVTDTVNEAATGKDYSFQIKADSSATFRLVGGELPPGLTLNSNGLISGSPTASGTYNFTVLASYNGDNIGKNFEIIVNGSFNFSSIGLIILIFIVGGAGYYFFRMKNQNNF